MITISAFLAAANAALKPVLSLPLILHPLTTCRREGFFIWANNPDFSETQSVSTPDADQEPNNSFCVSAKGPIKAIF